MLATAAADGSLWMIDGLTSVATTDDCINLSVTTDVTGKL